MRLRLVQNPFRRTGLYEDPQDFFVSTKFVLYQRVQLAVRKSAGTTFSELHIGIRIKHLLPPELLHICNPLLHTVAPLQKQWPVTMLRQQIPAEQTRRPRAYNNRPVAHLHIPRRRKSICFLIHCLNLLTSASGKHF